MKLEVLLIKSDTVSYDISENVGTVDFTDHINAPGVCTFSVLKDTDSQANPDMGNGLRVTCDGSPYFVGYIFKCVYSRKNESYSITAYDQLRYLKTSDTLVTKRGQTASQIVRDVCNLVGNLRMGAIEDTGHALGVMTFDEKGLLDMIAEAITATLTATQKLYYLKDEGGTAVFRSIESSISDLVIAPDSLLYDFSHERSIDSDTYNQIKLIRDNKETGSREVYIARDSETMRLWGTLQYYEKVEEGMNPEQVKQKADSLLYLKNRVGQKLSVDVIGEKSVRAGNVLYTEIPEAGVAKFLLCLSAKHRFSNTSHTVKADLKLV